MNVTAAETKPVEQLEDPLGSNVFEMITAITERLPYFRRIAMRRLDNAADAEDAVQDAFLAAWEHLDQYKGQAQMSTWLTTIVMNKSRTIVRKRAQVHFLPIDDQNESENHVQFAKHLSDCRPDPEAQFQNSECELRLNQLSARLSPALGIVVRMRNVEGLSVRETAEALGLTESAVKARTSRALAELRRLKRDTPHRPLPAPSPAIREANGSVLNLVRDIHDALGSRQEDNEYDRSQHGSAQGDFLRAS
jgi:RNA polymerase sigma-70 factor, ECF subfamily